MPLRRSRAPALLTAVAALAACGGNGGSKTEDLQTTTSASPAGGCKQVQARVHPNGGYTRQELELSPRKTYRLVFQTNCGSFTVTLNQKLAPNTTASLVSLARRGFFTDTFFHRIVPGFVIQGGDPTGRGTGGPGYKTVDRPPRNAAYTHGVVAMAKQGSEAPGTAGSQFFIVTAADAGLPTEYAIVGKVTQGLDVVDRIGKLGNPSTEEPTQAVVISRVRVQVT
jgi:peptidyl-prolyl cis-trans isomerase B (cyclophilin B)